MKFQNKDPNAFHGTYCSLISSHFLRLIRQYDLSTKCLIFYHNNLNALLFPGVAFSPDADNYNQRINSRFLGQFVLLFHKRYGNAI